MTPTIVIGIGNVLLRDEGVGVHVVRWLSELHGDMNGVEFLDAGAVGMKLVHILQGRRRAVLVDCALMGESPGTLRRFLPEEVHSIKALPGLSLHEGDLLAVIRLCEELGCCPEEIVMLGIEPGVVEPGEGLSPCLAERMDDYLAAVLIEIGT